MARKLQIMMFLFVAAVACLAGDKDDLVNLKNKQWISVPSVPQVSMAAGQKTTVQLKFQVGDGFHINSHTPKSDLLIPTTLNFTPVEIMTVGNIDYPKGKEFSLSYDPSEKLSVYTGEVILNVPLQASTRAKAGSYNVHAEIRYQACSDRACFPPRSYPLDLTITIK